MPLFYWTPQLETGNALVDAQHEALFDLTNRLSDLVAGPYDIPAAAALVAELLTHAQEHFCHEEMLMCKARLTARARDQHVCAHRNLVAQVSEAVGRTDLGDAAAIRDLLDFLVNWLVGHILKLDHRLVQALEDSRPGVVPGASPSVQKVLMTALTETERRFRLVAQQAPALIWLAEADGGRDFVNQGWCDLLGVPGTRPRATDWLALVHPEDRAGYAAQLARLQDRQERGEVEYRVRAAGGDWRWILERILPRLDGARCVGLVAASTDVTALKARQDTLLRDAAERSRPSAHQPQPVA
jgi:hemerythrin-like metal-binding protein/PAS domain S-box-containing protein